jgi:cellulose synthase/poly-beta-1,6-N-acetylglucosamine synthase-like glycosyltransferase
MILELCIIFLLLHLIIICLAIHKVSRKDEKPHFEGELPFVSILTAARNEEKNILNCLESLAVLDYTAGKLEVWLGDVQSTDGTAEIVADFIQRHSNFNLFRVTDPAFGSARGKSNVLAQLARKARGEYLFITDADITVQPGWIKGLLPWFTGTVAVVSGSTVVRSETLFGKMQGVEWLYLMGIFHFIDDFHPVAAMGNNMAVRASAYFETGGYENILFSLTEDYQLLLELLKKGYRHRQILDKSAVAFSSPTESYVKLLHQRKRWSTGGKQQPWFIIGLFVVYLLFLPVLLLLAFLNWPIAAGILGLKLLIDYLYLSLVKKRLAVNFLLSDFLKFELYVHASNFLVSVFSILPGKINWKGREY